MDTITMIGMHGNITLSTETPYVRLFEVLGERKIGGGNDKKNCARHNDWKLKNSFLLA